jgi:hypothetical protein
MKLFFTIIRVKLHDARVRAERRLPRGVGAGNASKHSKNACENKMIFFWLF